MPFPDHYLLSYGGTFVSDPGEIWSNNLRFAADDNLDGGALADIEGSDYADVLDNLVPKLSTMVNSSNSGYGSNVRMEWVKLNRIGPDGKYSDALNSHTRFLQSPYVQGGAASTHPISTALVLTFLTDRERGRGSKGRIYLPQPAVTLSSGTFRVSTTAIESILAIWTTAVNGLNDWGGSMVGQPKLSVLSKLGEGSARNVRRLQIGDVLDYMGSRRNRLKENRTTTPTLSSV